MTKEIITIGITAYNCHKYLLNAIKSVIDQGSDLWTGILILDGGADRKTRKIFEQFKHPKFQKYVHGVFQGRGHTPINLRCRINQTSDQSIPLFSS